MDFYAIFNKIIYFYNKSCDFITFLNNNTTFEQKIYVFSIFFYIITEFL